MPSPVLVMGNPEPVVGNPELARVRVRQTAPTSRGIKARPQPMLPRGIDAHSPLAWYHRRGRETSGTLAALFRQRRWYGLAPSADHNDREHRTRHLRCVPDALGVRRQATIGRSGHNARGWRKRPRRRVSPPNLAVCIFAPAAQRAVVLDRADRWRRPQFAPQAACRPTWGARSTNAKSMTICERADDWQLHKAVNPMTRFVGSLALPVGAWHPVAQLPLCAHAGCRFCVIVMHKQVA